MFTILAAAAAPARNRTPTVHPPPSCELHDLGNTGASDRKIAKLVFETWRPKMVNWMGFPLSRPVSVPPNGRTRCAHARVLSDHAKERSR